jgi:hypothetical protein
MVQCIWSLRMYHILSGFKYLCYFPEDDASAPKHVAENTISLHTFCVCKFLVL